MKILIIGANGFLGTKLKIILSKTNEVIGVDKEVIDATDPEKVKKFISKHKPEVVIDTVSLTSSLACENNPKLAEELNYLTAKNIAEACEENGSKMVFLSSTYIFDGEKGNYSEEDIPFPLNEYGRTKVMAEEVIKKLEDYLIIRVDLMYGFNGKDLPNGIFSKILSGDEIIIRDLEQQRSPVFVDDVVNSMETLFKKHKKGIFHLTGGDKISYFNFLKELEKPVRSETKIISAPKNKENLIKIPKFATLDNSKIISLGIKMHSLKEGIEELKKQINTDNFFQQP